ncbi:MAG: NAD(P)-dependent oxidoreductase, partial [Pirellulales bacterium]|nr:NAD(P)-dependent oxidoreductase [Pirellulales bacterium]
LSRMALRASQAAGVERRVIGVSRFSSGGLEEELNRNGIETIRYDLLDPEAVAALPDVKNVVFMAGMKFGTTGKESMTWVMNTVMPGAVARRYAGSRIVVFSTGNVYPLTPIDSGGARETDDTGPIGEYAASCLGRERVFQYYATELGSPTSIIRLNYAVEMRYGVLVDLARKVHEGRPVDLTMGYANVIWQADANAMILNSLGHASVPAAIFNVVGPETISVRESCRRLARLMGKEVEFVGHEAPDALLSNGTFAYEKLGQTTVDTEQMLEWIADWVAKDGETLGKPTHFEARDGKF